MAKSIWRKKLSQSQQDILMTLAELANVLEARKKSIQDGESPEKSYVASLFLKGDDAILKKIGEEAAETIMAAKDARSAMLNHNHSEKPQALINEVADLWFHSMVLLAQFDLRPEDVLRELKRREGVSGITEKASRT
jgi:phosphoribosyl-ATP pyrophosphohydrolase